MKYIIALYLLFLIFPPNVMEALFLQGKPLACCENNTEKNGVDCCCRKQSTSTSDNTCSDTCTCDVFVQSNLSFCTFGDISLTAPVYADTLSFGIALTDALSEGYISYLFPPPKSPLFI